MTKNFKGGTSPRIYPWNQSQIANLKSSSPRIYPWGQSKISNLKSKIDRLLTNCSIGAFSYHVRSINHNIPVGAGF